MKTKLLLILGIIVLVAFIVYLVSAGYVNSGMLDNVMYSGS